MARITVSEAKNLTCAKTGSEAFQMIFNRLIARKWTLNGKTYNVAGMCWRSQDGEQCMHLTLWEAATSGVYHERIKIALDDALDCVSGNFKDCQVV